MEEDIIFKSTYENITSFIEGKDFDKLLKLYFYISSKDYLNRPPDNFEKLFIEEFFSNEAWIKYIQSQKRVVKSYFKYVPPFDLGLITSILSFELLKISSKEIKKAKRGNIKRKPLEEDLEEAINLSYEGEVFYKVEGWSNVYEVLLKYNLVKKSN